MTDEEMADKHVEEYVMREDVITEYDRIPFDNGYGFQTVSFEDEVKKGYKDGFLAGLKARPQWHYVKDGDLPRQDGNTCFSIYVLANNKKWVYYHFGRGKWFCGNKEVKVIAWKEIIFPEENE